MVNLAAIVFAFALAALCREGRSFVIPSTSVSKWVQTNERARQSSSVYSVGTRGHASVAMEITTSDECKGVGPTPGWHRVAHRNGARIQIGDRLPTVEVRRLESDGMVRSMNLQELFGERKGVLVGVPGAFTPTCSKVHLPEFVDKASRLAAKGAELVVFISVNDVFVMRAWEEMQQAQGKVLMLADGNGDLAAALGMMVDLSAQGMGLRCKRFMCIVEGGRVSHITVDDGEGARGVCASTAERILDEALKGGADEVSLYTELEREVEARAGAAAAAAAVAAASASASGAGAEAGEAGAVPA